MKSKKTGLRVLVLFLLCLTLAGLLLVRTDSEKKKGGTPAAPAQTEEPTPAPPSPTPSAPPSPTAEPESEPLPAVLPAPAGYTEESYALVSDMVYAYADRQEAAEDLIRADLDQLSAIEPSLGMLWGKIMALWSSVNTELEIHDGVLPDGLPEDDSLCIVVLGFQLEPDGSMSPELRGRCEVALASAEKYPRALIAVTGGGTAWQNPSATEAGVMADWLIERGVAPSRVIREDASRTTADNAVFTCAILRQDYPQVKKLAVVTSDYHLPLGVLLFQEQALLYEYESGALPFEVISNAALNTEGRVLPDTPMFQKSYLWSLADPRY